MVDKRNSTEKQTESASFNQELEIKNNMVEDMPDYASLEEGVLEASRLVNDIVLKKYLYSLSDLELIPLDDDLKKISKIRLFRITEMVYQNKESSIHKFASVINSVQDLNCSVFVIADSNGERTYFYMGIRSLDNERTTSSLKNTLRNALNGQFPGVKIEDYLDRDAEKFLSRIAEQTNIASVSCIAKNKDEKFEKNDSFVQGLEKLVTAMQGKSYTVVILARSTPASQLQETRQAYETIYTQLSPFANMQLSYGSNTAKSISEALSHGTTTGESSSRNVSWQTGESISKSSSESHSETRTDFKEALTKTAANVVVGAASLVTAPLTGGASLAAAGAIIVAGGAIDSFIPKQDTDGESVSESYTVSHSKTTGETYGKSKSESENLTNTKGITSGSSNTMQLTMQNKTLIDTLNKIDIQLKRIDECESVGMWESAAYFLADTQETAEMAAGTYKALMKGEKSGVETSAINFWGQSGKKELVPMLREYITNFIHPMFQYSSGMTFVPVSAAVLVSGNELAIQMGLPRRSVCGFPVIEHADFGKEVVKYNASEKNDMLPLGKIYSMGKETTTDVRLDYHSLTMHTLITGSTGSGKSTAVYKILMEIAKGKNRRNDGDIHFLVVEPAKGEYKHALATKGNGLEVSVYGTNPSITPLLRINPFRFPVGQIHIYEHMDKLIEIFNVCWPMYAAMPAVLKVAIENAYKSAGWNLVKSENKYGNIFPTFKDVAKEIEVYINRSEYSDENKSNYKGSLLTRLESLTNGINGMIFSNNDIADEMLFDRNVIVDLSRVGSVETKSLIMGMIVLKLQEYRVSKADEMDSGLRHITVLEEAHNLLRKTSTEQSADSANLTGKSVEMLANAIAEMRTYGEGFIIADQAPGLLDSSVIRNTNTKIILRLPDFSDRELVGKSAGLNDEQILELAKLPRGVAAVYQNDWIDPVLCQVKKADKIGEQLYISPDKGLTVSEDNRFVIDLMDAELRKKLDNPDFEIDIRNKILKSPIETSIKVQLLEYLDVRNSAEGIKVLSKVLFDSFTNTKEILEDSADEESIEDFRSGILASLEPSLFEYQDDQINLIISLIMNEYVNRYHVDYPIWQDFIMADSKEAVK